MIAGNMNLAEKYLAPTWAEIYSGLEDLATKICASGFRPDIIVAIIRGGLVPGRIISDLLEQPNVATVRIECHVGTDRTKPVPKLSQPLSVGVKAQKVLLVDDVADTGCSLQLAKEHIEKSGAGAVRVATLYSKPWSKVKPDYFGEETSFWIVFPWEVKEIVRTAIENSGNTLLPALSETLYAKGLPKPLVDRFLKEIAGDNPHC